MTIHTEITPCPSYTLDRDLCSNIPADLKARKQWVVWQYWWNAKANKGRGKWTKPPYSPFTGLKCNFTDTANFADFDTAYSQAIKLGMSGIGFVLTPDCGLVGIDLDGCSDAPWTRSILEHPETYAEVSPSGNGYRIIAKGSGFADLRAKSHGIEIYESGRYLTITGNKLAGSPSAINKAPKTLAALQAQITEFVGEPEQAAKPDSTEVNLFFRSINNAALKNIGPWMEAIFGDQARLQSGTKAYRVSAADLGRDLEEDLSVHPNGIHDFGMETTKTAIDLVMEHAGAPDAMKAALWLCEQIGLDPVSLGYNERHATTASEPLPLFPEAQPALPYPMDALGPLAEPAKAIQRKVKAPDALAAQSVLAAASLAVQGFADVAMPSGQTRPTSLYMVTIAASGDRKSSCDSQALKGIWTHERDLKADYDEDLESFKRRHAIYSAQHRKIVNDKKLTVDDQHKELLALGREPERPLSPMKAATDTTLEGLVKQWIDGHPSMGLFSAEGGMFTGGHGMKAENKLNTAGQLSALWDGSPVKRIRAGDGLIMLHGRRLAMHLMLQPSAAQQFFSDPVLRDQGLLSRPLVAYPASLAGHRPFEEPKQADEVTITAFQNDLLSILRTPLQLREETRNELEPKTIGMSDDAKAIWIDFYNHIEDQQRQDGPLRSICDFASKAAEHAARIAAVLQLFQNVDAEEISAEMMEYAAELTNWYVAETLRLHEAGQTAPELTLGQKLLDWIKAGNETFSIRQAQQKAPRPLRTKKALEDAIATLVDHGQITQTSKKPATYTLVA